MVRPFRAKYTISRQDFCKNLGDTLTAVPRVLVRSMMLLIATFIARASLGRSARELAAYKRMFEYRV